MKKVYIIAVIVLACSISGHAQTWTNGSGLLYSNPLTTKIGVGISYPTELFHVNGGALKIGNAYDSLSRAKNLLKFGDGNYVWIGEFELDDMLSFKANRYNFNNGNVGIGVTIPAAKLDVNGSFQAKEIVVNHTATEDWHFALRVHVNRDVTRAIAVLNSAGIDVFRVYGNGITYTKYLVTERIKVNLNALNISWFDHVFAPDYQLMPLSEVEQFVKTNH